MVPADLLPPPYDRHPDFPTVTFDATGQPHVYNAPVNMICQAVPAWDNNYVHRYVTAARYRRWMDSDRVYTKIVTEWAAGARVTYHPRTPNARVVGVSRGMPRFICGAGLLVFIVDELGELPAGSTIGGHPTGGMIAVNGVDVPCSDNTPPNYHLFPREYLADPYLPGLPGELTPAVLTTWLAPPPIFFRGRPVPDNPDLVYASIRHTVSVKEREEGGLHHGAYVRRGGSYLIIHGPHLRRGLNQPTTALSQ
jgi:hypothetical protein